MRVISFLNRKGGVGKSSLCHHLAGAFAKMGRSVLLVDMDPQASLSRGLFGLDLVEDTDPASTVAEVLAGRLPFPEALIRETSIPRVALVMGSAAADDHDVPRPFEASMPRQACLRNFLHEVELGDRGIDLVLVDCPPSLRMCSWAALQASHDLVIPIHPEDYAAQGLSNVLDTVDRARRTNPRLGLLGIAISRIKRRLLLHRENAELLRELYGGLVFDATVRDLAAFPEAIGRRRPVEQYEPRSGAAHDIRLLAREILDRVQVREAGFSPSLATPVEAN